VLGSALALALLGLSCRSAGTHGSMDDGRELYAANGCATCHGASGRGDGPVGKTLSPPPRDFRDESSYTNGRDQDSIAATLARGIDRNGAKMPAFAHLTGDERRSLALFVISLRNPKEERTIR
jgi:high-affinity iron transporter